jgi:putative transposase
MPGPPHRIGEIVLSLTAKGLTTGEVTAHIADVCGATVSRDTMSRITDKVVGKMTDWCNRPPESVRPVAFIDAIPVKIGQVAVAATAVTVGVGRWARSDALHHLRVDRLVEEIDRDVRPLGLPPGGPLVGT